MKTGGNGSARAVAEAPQRTVIVVTKQQPKIAVTTGQRK